MVFLAAGIAGDMRAVTGGCEWAVRGFGKGFSRTRNLGIGREEGGGEGGYVQALRFLGFAGGDGMAPVMMVVVVAMELSGRSVGGRRWWRVDDRLS